MTPRNDIISYWMLGLTFFGAFMTAGSIVVAIAFRFMNLSLDRLKLTVDKSILEANDKQLQQLKGTYIQSMSSTLTGTEISRIFAEMQRDIVDMEEAHRRHAKHNAEMALMWTAELAKLKVSLPSSPPSGG